MDKIITDQLAEQAGRLTQLETEVGLQGQLIAQLSQDIERKVDALKAFFDAHAPS